METHPIAELAAPVVVNDRRRPGRRDDVSPNLTDLLRTAGGGGLLATLDDDNTSPLSASRGIKLAITLSAPIWALALVFTVWLLR